MSEKLEYLHCIAAFSSCPARFSQGCLTSHDERGIKCNWFSFSNRTGDITLVFFTNDSFRLTLKIRIVKINTLFAEDTMSAVIREYSTINQNSTQDNFGTTEQNQDLVSRLNSKRGPRKPALTLANGRRSKYLILHGEEAIKRERRRERNRNAAQKLREKRQIIEEDLQNTIQSLESQHFTLENLLVELRTRKEFLESQLRSLSTIQLLEEFSLSNSEETPPSSEPTTPDDDLFYFDVCDIPRSTFDQYLPRFEAFHYV